MVFDFLKENYVLIAYGVSFLLSLKSYRNYFDTSLRFFPMILAYTFFNELLGTLITYSQDFQLVFDTEDHFRNAVIYNVYHLIFFAYFFWVIGKTFISPFGKKIALTAIVLLVLANIINPFFQDFFMYSQVYAYLTGALLLIILCILYLFNLRKVNKYAIKNNLLFWTVMGLLLFHIIYFPIKISKEFYIETYEESYRTVHVFSVILMHLLFCIGFVLGRRRTFR